MMIMAGGTGGHIFPALAVAEKMRAAGWQVVWLGNPEGMEARLVPQYGFDLYPVRFSALRGKGLLRKLMLPFNLLRGFRQAWKVLGEVKPHVVLGFGGYITFPGGMMAALRGVPLVLHEQNSVAGLANRVLASVADRVLTGFPAVLPKAEWVGNPVRPVIANLPIPAERLADRQGALRVLVIGGSLGAQILNEKVPAALATLPAHDRPQVVHQAGEKHLDTLQANYQAAGVNAHCVAFVDDMAGAYEWADLLICRAGALTVAEVAAAGIAAIFVPYPHAVDDHQTGNAHFLADAGAAFLIEQKAMTPESLAALLQQSRGQLLEMAAKARALSKPDAAEAVVTVCVEVAK